MSTSIAPTARAAVASDSSSAGGICTSVKVVPSVQQKHLLWAKATASKALKENTNIAKRMGKMKEVGQGMTLLEKMRQVIGPSFDEEYKARVRTLYAALPDFTTFDTAVNVIDVLDAEEDMMPTPKTKKRPFELQDIEIKQEVDSWKLRPGIPASSERRSRQFNKIISKASHMAGDDPLP